MIHIYPYFKPTASTTVIKLLSLISHLCGVRDVWVEPLPLSARFLKCYKPVSFIIEIITMAYCFSFFASFITQKNLTIYQMSDQKVYSFSYTFFYFNCFVMSWYRDRYRHVFFTLLVTLKQELNDSVVEKQMIRKFLTFLIASWFIGTLALLFVLCLAVQRASAGYSFVTCVTAWPDVEDFSTAAGVARVLLFIFWIFSYLRNCICGFLYILLLICNCYQYKNLQQYFCNLKSIFNENISQNEMEIKYEKAFIRSVRMHSITIWCMNETQYICQWIFNGQIILTLSQIISLMPVLVDSETSYSSKVWFIPAGIMSLLVPGCTMWNAGDLSVEASRLPDAMYGSGWENCRGRSSVRIRKLLVIAVNQAQQPVALKAFGVWEISYASYMAIVKTSYSVFSVFA